MYKSLFFEISSVCNANCKYCSTGSRKHELINYIKKYDIPKFIKPVEFKKALDYMLINNIIDQETVIRLFNWGEPFLNPYLSEILLVLHDYNINFYLSTNASIIPNFDNIPLNGLQHIVFSVPGFSQDSYNRIHGFDFDKIKNNITTLVSIFKKKCPNIYIELHMHLYKFNMNEIMKAAHFARNNQIKIRYGFAILNGFQMALQYITNSLPINVRRSIDSEIFTEIIYNNIPKNLPTRESCPQDDSLVLGTNSKISTCCISDNMSESDNSYSIFDLNLNDIKQLHKKSQVCKICKENHLDYIAHNTPMFDEKSITYFLSSLLQ